MDVALARRQRFRRAFTDKAARDESPPVRLCSDSQDLVQVPRLIVETIKHRAARTSSSGPHQHRGIDGLEAAAHVARHYALLEGEEDDAAGTPGVVEVVARSIAVSVELRPA